MSTVYLDRNTLSISAASGRLMVEPSARGRGSIPLALISRLVIRGKIKLDTSTLGVLAEAGIAVVCLSGRSHRRIAQVLGAPGNDAVRRIHQFKAATHEVTCTEFARQLIDAKLSGSQRELVDLLQRRPALRRAVMAAQSTLERTRSQIHTAGIDQLRGLEGAAAAAWYRALAVAMPANLEFNGRNRRPPRDPVNVCMSLAYTLAHAEAVAACHAHGLDPMLGFLHEPAHGRESLACDLIEPLRPRIDGRLLVFLSSRGLKSEHFSTSETACQMNKSGRARFYQWWEQEAPVFRRYLRTRGHELIKALAQVSP